MCDKETPELCFQCAFIPTPAGSLSHSECNLFISRAEQNTVLLCVAPQSGEHNNQLPPQRLLGNYCEQEAEEVTEGSCFSRSELWSEVRTQ